MKRNLAVLLLVAIMLMLLNACDTPTSKNPQSSQDTNEMDKTNTSQSIKIKDIDWTVDEGIINGERYVTFDYTNNSKYTITSFIIEFSQKTDISEEELEKCYTDLQDYFNYSDERLEEEKQQSLLMYAYSEKVVNPGETQTDLCYYDYGLTYLKNIDYYNIMQPNIATIKYIDGDMIRTIYYDFLSKKYSFSDEIVAAYQWSENELSNKIPKPDAQIVEVIRDRDYVFQIYIRGVSIDQFDLFVKECKNTGFVVDARSDKDDYRAYNAEGYELRVSFEENSYINCSVKTPDN